MKKIFLWVAFFMSTWLLLTGCWGWSDSAEPTWWWTPQVCNKTECFSVEIADEPDEITKWLMWREELADDAGMLFVFEALGHHRFWMKNTLIPLDIIRLNENGEVVYIKEYAPPCSEEDSANNTCQLFGPEEWVLAKYVLEVNANKTRTAWIYEWIKMDLYNIQ